LFPKGMPGQWLLGGFFERGCVQRGDRGGFFRYRRRDYTETRSGWRGSSGPGLHPIEDGFYFLPMATLISQIPDTAQAALEAARLTDKFGRRITDLRVSVTDRCNYRCVYCRAGEAETPPSELPMEDYLRMVRVFAGLGIEKVRLTGGEPLLRRGLVELVQELSLLRTPDRYGLDGQIVPGRKLDIALTTNGHLLAAMAQPLRDAGLDRVTVSMDAVEPETFARITRVPGSFDHVLRGVRAARDTGLGPVKVNCVLLRGFNDDQIVPFAVFARTEGVIVRFIEFMPLEEDRIWAPDTVVPLDEVLERLRVFKPVVALKANAPSETARRYTFEDGVGEIGVIAPVSQAFCGACSRVRLTSDGKIRTCLFSHFDHDLHGVMRGGGSDAEMVQFIEATIQKKEARHHIGEAGFLQPGRTMVHIGG
jgi:cyclic pyranopterin phosphate synthase